ncbi:surface protease GP63 [Trypanosoma cruzi]|nr:surface protease GP63 [Trypanosoma cruzi]
MRQPRHTTPLLPLLLPWLMMVVCCTGVCVAADRAVKHRCGFDAMMKKYGRLPTAVVREVPRRGQGAVQAYTAASEDGDDGWAPIRIKVSAEDMFDPLRHCSAAGDPRIDQNLLALMNCVLVMAFRSWRIKLSCGIVFVVWFSGCARSAYSPIALRIC